MKIGRCRKATYQGSGSAHRYRYIGSARQFQNGKRIAGGQVGSDISGNSSTANYFEFRRIERQQQGQRIIYPGINIENYFLWHNLSYLFVSLCIRAYTCGKVGTPASPGPSILHPAAALAKRAAAIGSWVARN